jgi:PAS domain S-box-containing protein
MLRARDAGSVVMTGLVRPNADGEAGVLLFMPVYAHDQPLATAADRRRHLTGWVMAVFGLGDLVASLYGEGTPGVDLRIHDGTALDDSSRVHPLGNLPAPRTPRFEAQEYLAFAGHTWTLWARSLPSFEQPPGQDPVQVIAVAGGGLAVALSLLTWLLVTGRARAMQTAGQMTHQLGASERRYRRIVETASEGIWMLDAEGRTRFANPALQRLLGCDEAQLQARPCADFLDSADHAALLASADSPAAEPCELRLRRSDGGTLWARVSARRLTEEDGAPAGLLAMVTDDSQRHADEDRRALLEDQLRQSQKMEAIGTLAGGIAHDFNNILAAILGNAALAGQDLGLQHPAQPRLQQITQAGTRARSLVQQIVTFSRQQPQALVVQPLGPLLEEAARLLRATLPARVTLDLQIPAEPLPVAVDATQFQQVLLNLCTNAWHALPGGAGSITIGLAAGRPDGSQPGPQPDAWVHLWVRDDGCGMDEATRQRIFEPFFTTKPVGQGTGLGLAVVHGIVASHGGTITVDSTPGAGSTFHLLLPRAAVPAQVASADAGAVPGRLGQGQLVLYVDDDAVMGLMVESLLQRQGWRVVVLDNPKQALARALDADDPVDLVVTDFNMPGESGLDLAQALIARRPGLPVIITSGYITDHLRSEAARLGVRHVLQKEHTLEQLGLQVAQVLAAVAP